MLSTRSPRNSIRPLVTSPRSARSRFETALSVVVLPAPLAPEERDDAALGNGERDALQHEDHVVVDDLDAVDFEEGLGLFGPWDRVHVGNAGGAGPLPLLLFRATSPSSSRAA